MKEENEKKSTLRKYVDSQDKKNFPTRFSKQLGIRYQALYQYMNLEKLPSPRLMMEIESATNFEVGVRIMIKEFAEKNPNWHAKSKKKVEAKKEPEDV